MPEITDFREVPLKGAPEKLCPILCSEHVSLAMAFRVQLNHIGNPISFSRTKIMVVPTLI